MKKRILSVVALLLLMAMLLCSCAEGLPLSELYFATKEAVTEYRTQLKLLQAGSRTLAANGASEYVISLERTASQEVKGAVHALAARIKKQTDVDLLDSTREGATKRILIGLPEKDSTPLVQNAAQFYIGFSGEDLIIQAQNEMMLISALSFFTEYYLSDEKEALILSPDFSYLSPTATYRTREHSLIRAEQTGATATQAATSFCDTLFDTTGIRFSVKSDFNSTGGLTDILFGYPDDEEAQTILAELSFDDFYIGVRGGRLMILAKNDPALVEATDLFLSTFVTAENAAFDKEEKTIVLPAICDYYHRSDAILLADEGINRAVLIYGENASSTTKQAAKNFAALYKRLTNAELPIHADTEYRPNIGSFEILVGETNRELPQLNYLKELPYGQWAISVVPEANAISIFANGQIATLAALDQLGKALTAQTRAISKAPANETDSLQGGINRTLYIKPALSLNGAEPPTFPTAYRYTFQEHYYRLVSTTKVSEKLWKSYRNYLIGIFPYQSQLEEDGVIITFLHSETRNITLKYTKSSQTLELRVTPHAAR